MNNYYKNLENIHKYIESKDYDSLSDSLDLLYKSKHRSATAKSAICFGYQLLARVSKLSDPVITMQSLDRARQMFPSDSELLENELEHFEKFIQNINLTQTDFDLIDAILLMIKTNVPISANLKLEKVFSEFYNNLQKKVTSNNSTIITSNLISETGAVLYINLTDEMRDKITKELTPHLPTLFEAAKKLGLFDELEMKKRKKKEG